MRLVALLFALVACGDSGGQLGDTCTDGTCNSGLVCINDTCVAELCSEGAADDCCPDNANALTDPDCAPACGNAVVEPGELCDTAIASGEGVCPSTCDSAVGCTITTLADDGTCVASCTTTTIAVPVNGDTCCPSGANANTDNDCSPVCGNGVLEGTEGCDDTNTANNDGCSSLCVEAPLSLDVAVVQPTIDTELATTHQIDVTLTATNGFMGAVTLAVTVVDGNQQPVAWNAVLDDATHDLAQNGTASTFVTLTIPSRNVGLAATINVTATSTADAGNFTASTAVTVANVITIPVTVTAGQCVYPPASTLEVTIGTTLHFLNAPTSEDSIIIHSDGNANGVPHQDVATSTPQGAFYAATVSGVPAGPIEWYCHSPGPSVSDRLIQPVAP